MPKTLNHWLTFAAAVFIVGVAINTIARRVPAVAQISAGF